MTVAPLGDLRVVDLSSGIAGAYACKLLSDAGADVVKVEPPTGDPLRRWTASGADLGGADGALFTFLAAGTRSVVAEPGDGTTAQLVAGADAVVDNGTLDPRQLRSADPGLVVVSITPYGRSGPLAGRPTTEFVVQAECGSIAGRGVMELPPVQAGGRIGEWSAGAYAAAAALAAVRAARQTGQGAFLDVTELESTALATNLFSDLMWSLLGIVPDWPARMIEVPSVYRTADGWVGFNTNGPQHVQAFFRLVERPDLGEDTELQGVAGRIARRPEVDAVVTEWTTRHTTDEVLAKAAELRVPAARVNDGASVVREEHLVARGFYVESADGRFRQPSPHYRIDSERPLGPRPAPRLGEHTGSVEHRERVSRDATAESGHPLQGLKVLDVTAWWAGPAATHFLAAMGADVLHVESPRHPDPMRVASAVLFHDRDRWWEYGSFYLSINTSKRGITLDLGDERGRALLRRLVEWADVVVENYTPRVLEKFGLDWATVQELNPQAVLVRMPAFGLDGPWRDRLGFAQTMEQMSGMAWVTGFADREPLIPRGPVDPVGGVHASFAALVGLAQREATGRGVLVEVPLVESALNMAAEQVVEASAYGTVLGREGNRSRYAAPQGLYACRGSEQWLALSVATDEHWRGLVSVIGEPAWQDDPGLADLAGRRSRHDELDARIARWSAEQELLPAVDALIAAGVPAATLADPRMLHAHPQVVARGFAEEVDHPVTGRQAVFGLPLRWDGIDRWIRSPAPTMGQHDDEVLSGLLGLDGAEIAALRADGVISDHPL